MRTKAEDQTGHAVAHEIVTPSNSSEGTRHNNRPAVPRSHAPSPARSREACAPVPGVLRSQRDGDGVLDPEGRRNRPRAFTHPRAAGAVPGTDAGSDGP